MHRELSPIPEADTSDSKEVFAFFGLCAYHAQILERNLINLAVGLRMRGLSQLAEGESDQMFLSMERKTLGQLINDVRKLTTVPAEVEKSLQIALRNRNHLAHRFFAVHDIDLMSESGREEMITELRDRTQHLQNCDREVERITLQVWKQLGITDSILELELAQMKAEAARREKQQEQGCC